MRYVRLAKGNKNPIEKLRNGGHELEEVQDYPDLGVLIPEPFVVLDFDTKSDAEIMLKIAKGEGLKTRIMETDNGYHFWFKSKKIMKNFVKRPLACGLVADCRSWGKWSYTVVRRDGKWRKWLQPMEDEEIQYIPKWLTPVVEIDVDFKKMKNGDGRNNALFEYIIDLQKQGFTKDEIKETFNIINKYVFQEPLDDRELNEQILRDDAFIDLPDGHGTWRNEKGQIQHNLFAEAILEEYNIVTSNDQIYIYNNGYYQRDNGLLEKKMLEMAPDIKSHMRNEVLSYIKIKTNKEVNRVEFPYIINIENGRLDVRTRILYKHSPEYVEFERVPVKYNPDAYDINVDKMLDKVFCHDKEVQALFEEMLGYCLIKNTKYQKGFMFYGSGSNGKSTVLNMIREFLGHENVANVDLTKLHENYAAAELENKLANLGDDIDYGKIKETGIVKKLYSGDAILTRRIYGEPFNLYNHAKMIFATNELPYSGDKTHGFYRRFEIIPLHARFSSNDEDYDPFIEEKVTTENAKSYLLNLALDGVDRLISRGKFTQPKVVSEAKKDYKILNSNVLTWIYDENLDEEYLMSKPISDLYSDFTDYCKLAGVKHQTSRTKFTQEINAEFGFVSKPKYINGKIHRVFMKEE